MQVKSTHDTGQQAAPGGSSSQDVAHTSLALLPQHDAKRWGADLSNDVPPQRLVRLAGLVRLTCARTGVESVQWCAAKVLAKLAAGGPLRLFALQLGPLACLVPDDKLWRPRYLSGPEKFSARHRELASGYFRVLWSLSDEEAQARGIKLGCRSDLSDEEMQALPELPELRGPAGALALMQVQWVEQAQTFDDLDAGPLASLAMVAADAVRMFGCAPAGEASNARPVDVRIVQPTTFEPKHNADKLGPLVAGPTDEATPGGALCSLADLVDWVMYRDATPRRPAASNVAGELGKAAPPPLYLTNRDTWAARLTAMHEWWPKVDGRTGGVVRQVVKVPVYRVMELGGSSDASPNQEQRKVVKPRAAMPGAYGESGAWQVLRDAWCSDDKAARDKAMNKHGATLERLAIPMRVGVELFGYGQMAEVVPAGEAAAKPAVGNVAGTMPADFEVLAAWNKLNVKGGKPTATLAARYGVSADTIQRAKRRAATAAAVSKAAAKRGTAANPFGSVRKTA